jgi:hypothetical protein
MHAQCFIRRHDIGQIHKVGQERVEEQVQDDVRILEMVAGTKRLTVIGAMYMKQVHGVDLPPTTCVQHWVDS